MNGIAVGEATHEATASIFEFEELEPVELKGKAEPVRLWWAKAARSRFGTDVTRTHTTPLVGRELERDLLTATFERAVRDRSVHLVTVVGEPGIGKSRLVAELFAYSDRSPDLVTWRQGRCLPYGEGIAFWALGEIVKAAAGILESDAPDVAAEKIDLAVQTEQADARWLRQRLRPLVGLDARRGRAGGELRRVATVPGDRRRGRTRSCWSSRISTGPTKRCSPSWRRSSSS